MGAMASAVRTQWVERNGNDWCRVGFCEMQGHRHNMEDAHILDVKVPLLYAKSHRVQLTNTINDQNGQTKAAENTIALFAIFDGHGGPKAAQYMSQQLLKQLGSLPSLTDESLVELLVSLDTEFLKSPSYAQGCTCCFVLIQPDPVNYLHKNVSPAAPPVLFFHLTIVNLGDSRCYVIDRKTTSVRFVTRDHKPNVQSETERIEAAGGYVTDDGRVDGELTVSRAIGDGTLKQLSMNNKTVKKNLKKKIPAYKLQKVIAVPDITHITCTNNDLVFVTCDGLIEKLSSEQIAQYLVRRVNEMKEVGPDAVDPALIMSELVSHSLQAGSKDNMSCMLIHFSDGTNYVNPTLSRPKKCVVFADWEEDTKQLEQTKNNNNVSQLVNTTKANSRAPKEKNPEEEYLKAYVSDATSHGLTSDWLQQQPTTLNQHDSATSAVASTTNGNGASDLPSQSPQPAPSLPRRRPVPPPPPNGAMASPAPSPSSPPSSPPVSPLSTEGAGAGGTQSPPSRKLPPPLNRVLSPSKTNNSINGNANGNANGNTNGNANGNAHSSANGSANAGVNGSANAGVNGNTTPTNGSRPYAPPPFAPPPHILAAAMAKNTSGDVAAASSLAQVPLSTLALGSAAFAGGWNCPLCGFYNNPTANRCELCEEAVNPNLNNDNSNNNSNNNVGTPTPTPTPTPNTTQPSSLSPVSFSSDATAPLRRATTAASTSASTEAVPALPTRRVRASVGAASHTSLQQQLQQQLKATSSFAAAAGVSQLPTPSSPSSGSSSLPSFINANGEEVVVIGLEYYRRAIDKLKALETNTTMPTVAAIPSSPVETPSSRSPPLPQRRLPLSSPSSPPASPPSSSSVLSSSSSSSSSSAAVAIATSATGAGSPLLASSLSPDRSGHASPPPPPTLPPRGRFSSKTLPPSILPASPSLSGVATNVFNSSSNAAASGTVSAPSSPSSRDSTAPPTLPKPTRLPLSMRVLSAAFSSASPTPSAGVGAALPQPPSSSSSSVVSASPSSSSSASTSSSLSPTLSASSSSSSMEVAPPVPHRSSRNAELPRPVSPPPVPSASSSSPSFKTRAMAVAAALNMPPPLLPASSGSSSFSLLAPPLLTSPPSRSSSRSSAAPAALVLEGADGGAETESETEGGGALVGANGEEASIAIVAAPRFAPRSSSHNPPSNSSSFSSASPPVMPSRMKQKTLTPNSSIILASPPSTSPTSMSLIANSSSVCPSPAATLSNNNSGTNFRSNAGTDGTRLSFNFAPPPQPQHSQVDLAYAEPPLLAALPVPSSLSRHSSAPLPIDPRLSSPVQQSYVLSSPPTNVHTHAAPPLPPFPSHFQPQQQHQQPLHHSPPPPPPPPFPPQYQFGLPPNTNLGHLNSNYPNPIPMTPPDLHNYNNNNNLPSVPPSSAALATIGEAGESAD